MNSNQNQKNQRYIIYCDESGESSFSESSSYNHFTICTLSIPTDKIKKVKNTIKRKKAKLYKLGWPRNLEIKASILHGLQKNKSIPNSVKKSLNGDSFINEVLLSLKRACSPRIDYIVIKKSGIKDEKFKAAPYGIAYNFFAGKIIIPLILELKNCHFIIDQRNKEMHAQKHFDGYIETEVRGKAFENNVPVNLAIQHSDSRIAGLKAVDFFCWSIFRKFESNDSRFYETFEDLICQKERWYC
ncbi:DUF3800 domain-containing protein [Candidatus Margulisiibacteriota bacterium]